METADGEFLNNILKTNENFQKFSDVMNWTEQMLDGLSYLNLHLPNVILRRSQTAKHNRNRRRQNKNACFGDFEKS